jgi:hypothetical protein
MAMKTTAANGDAAALCRVGTCRGIVWRRIVDGFRVSEVPP